MKQNFLDEQLVHQVRLDRVENGIIDNVLKILNNSNNKVKKELLKTNGVYTKKHYKELEKYISSVSRELTEEIENGMTFDDFVEYELKAQKKMFSKNGINLKYPSKEQIITSSLFAPYSDTSTFKSFLDSVDSRFYQMWDSSIRTGYLLGTPTQKIVRDVLGEVAKNSKVAELGLMNSLKNSIKANTRTVLQAMANETREKVFKKNEELFSGYRYYATLDKRSCLICGNLDGIVKKDVKDFGVRIPIHYNCRCVILPIVKGFEDFEDTRASASGQVSDNVTYEQWLERQDDSTKQFVLGKKRFELYEKGQKFSSFVSDEKRIIPLKEIDTQIKRYTIDKNNVIINRDEDIISGAISGALDPNSKRALKHADLYYESIRKMKTDIDKISNNTEFSKEDVKNIKNYIFNEEHKLGKKIRRFDSSYEMAESWQRLIEGKNIQSHDLTLLKHELLERDYVLQGLSQEEAHIKASAIYNYKKESDIYYGKTKKNKKN